MVKAILILPGNVLVVIPFFILYFTGVDGVCFFSWWSVPVGMLLGSGFFLMVWTMRLFSQVGKGSPAPWDPIDRLITSGPYAYMRNPMLTGVFMVLLAEVLFFQSMELGIYFFLFFLANVLYFSFSEEPALEKRYGNAYREYKVNVPRFIPRARAWDCKGM